MANTTPTPPTTQTKTVFNPLTIFGPTPAWASNVADIILYAAVVLNGVVPLITQIPASVQHSIASYSLEITGAVTFICNSFGIKTTTPLSTK